MFIEVHECWIVRVVLVYIFIGLMHEEVELITAVEITASFTWANVSAYASSVFFNEDLFTINAAIAFKVPIRSLTAANTSFLGRNEVVLASVSWGWAADARSRRFIPDVVSESGILVQFTACFFIWNTNWDG